MKRDTSLARVAVLAVVILAVVTLAVITISKYSQFRAQAQAGAQSDRPTSATTDSTKTAIEDTAMYYKGVRYVPRRGVESYLILGLDRTEAQRNSSILNGQSDVVLLLVLDPRESRYRILQLNRDTVTLINILSPDGTIAARMYKPVCLAHSYAHGAEQGGENVSKAVSWLLQDAPIDGFISLDLQSIDVLNDAVGGVTVRIPYDLTDADPSFVEGATVTLNAQTAEKFIRARMSLGETNNANRMGRQELFMKAWLDTARTKAQQDPKFAARLLERLEPILVTNLTEKRMSGIASDAGKYENEGFLKLEGEYRLTDGFQYFYADEESLMETILELFYQAEQ